MVDALHQRPCGARDPSGDRFGSRGARVERLYAQAVVGLAHQPLVECRALERRLDKLTPVRLGGRREFSGEGKVIRHAGKLAQSASSGY